MRAYFDAGPVNVQVWVGGKRAIFGELTLNGPNSPGAWQELAQAVKLLRSITGPEQEKNLKVSIKALSAARGLKTIHDVVSAPTFRVEFNAQGMRLTRLRPFSTILGRGRGIPVQCTYRA